MFLHFCNLKRICFLSWTLAGIEFEHGGGIGGDAAETAAPSMKEIIRNDRAGVRESN